MRNGRLVVVGAGGHAAVAADCASESTSFDEIVLVDDRWPSLHEKDGWQVIDTVRDYLQAPRSTDHVFIALGDAGQRERIFAEVHEKRLRLATIVHPRSVVSRKADLGRGCLVVAGAVINCGANVEDGAIVNTGATIDHHCHLGRFVHAAPGANVGGAVSVGVRSWLGIGCAIKHGTSIGEDVTVGAGAVVIKDVPDGVTVVGVPARVLNSGIRN